MKLILDKRLIKVSDYQRMIEAGILTEEDRVELLNGEIINMSPIGKKYAIVVWRISELLKDFFEKGTVIWAQNPLEIGEYSVLEPDIAVLKGPWEQYRNRLPNAADVLLLVEVADTTLEKDRLVKLPLYAASGIPEYWIVNLQEQIVEVYQQASNDTYNRLQKYHLEDQIPLGPLEGSLSVKDFLA